MNPVYYICKENAITLLTTKKIIRVYEEQWRDRRVIGIDFTNTMNNNMLLVENLDEETLLCLRLKDSVETCDYRDFSYSLRNTVILEKCWTLL